MEILFADESNAASYSLLALPKALYEEQLEIRGSSAQPATLVTSDATYSIQGTQHSNSLLLLLEPNQIQATLHETLTLVRNYPNFSGLLSLLHGTDYVGEEEDGGRREVTLDDLRDVLPASDSEIEAALVKNRVLDLDGRLRLLPNSFLLAILPKLLEGMDPPISLPSSKDESQAKGKRKAVAMEQKTGPILAKSSREATLDWFEQVDLSTVAGMKLLRWYGDVENQNWELRVEDIVRDIGVALLAAGGFSHQPLKAFMSSWQALTYGFSSLASLSLLPSIHLLPPSTPQEILYYPVSRLSSDPSTRFTELFSQKPRWKEEEMTHFINDLVGGDRKKREAMVLKFVRKVKESDGSNVWTARNLW